MQKVYGRREFIRRHFFLGSAFLSAAIVLSECESKKGSEEGKNEVKTNPCEDLSGVSKNDIEARIKFGYVKKSPLPDKTCNNCKLHIPPRPEKNVESVCCLKVLFILPGIVLTGRPATKYLSLLLIIKSLIFSFQKYKMETRVSGKNPSFGFIDFKLFKDIVLVENVNEREILIQDSEF